MTLIRPQRIFAPSAPGALLKRFGTDAARQPRKDDGDADRNHLALVRQCPCLKCGMEPSEAAHVRFASAAFGKASGMQKTPPDKFAVPLCSGCHRLAKDAQHNGSEREFWHAIDINPLAAASLLWDARSDLVRMISVVHVVIAGRKKR